MDMEVMACHGLTIRTELNRAEEREKLPRQVPLTIGRQCCGASPCGVPLAASHSNVSGKAFLLKRQCYYF